MHKTLVSRIYAPAQRHDKDEFWKHLIELNTFINTPWCLVGDVNKLGAPNEKKGGGKYSPSINLKELTTPLLQLKQN